jgi:hypothetical protein
VTLLRDYKIVVVLVDLVVSNVLTEERSVVLKWVTQRPFYVLWYQLCYIEVLLQFYTNLLLWLCLYFVVNFAEDINNTMLWNAQRRVVVYVEPPSWASLYDQDMK